jgi:hypothetical protein
MTAPDPALRVEDLEVLEKVGLYMQIGAGFFFFCGRAGRLQPAPTTQWLRRQPVLAVVRVPCNTNCRAGMLFVETRLE